MILLSLSITGFMSSSLEEVALLFHVTRNFNHNQTKVSLDLCSGIVQTAFW